MTETAIFGGGCLNESQPYCQFVIAPKVDKLLNMFPNLVKTQTPS